MNRALFRSLEKTAAKHYHGSPVKDLTTLRAGSWVTPHQEDALRFGVPWGSKDLVDKGDESGRPPKHLRFKPGRAPKDQPVYVYETESPTRPADTNMGKRHDWNHQVIEEAPVRLVAAHPSWKKVLHKEAMAKAKKPEEFQPFLDEHFNTPETAKWKAFRKKLVSPAFIQAVKKDERADSKLKRYAENNGRHMQAKGVPVYKVPSQTSSKSYTVKFHPAQQTFSCNCGDWIHKQSTKTKKDKECKHVAMLKLQLWAKGDGRG